MTNLEKYQEAFTTTFGITKEELETLEYQGIPSWDSVRSEERRVGKECRL